jgi:hypothetical protein
MQSNLTQSGNKNYSRATVTDVGFMQMSPNGGLRIALFKRKGRVEEVHAALGCIFVSFYGYGRYLHRSFSKLKSFPVEPAESKPSPPNIQNSWSPVWAGVVVQ